MKKAIQLAIFLLFLNVNAQVKNKEIEKSTTRIFLDEAKKTRVNKDWTLIAKFESGIGETVEFYPVQLIDLKTKETVNALQLDMNIKVAAGFGKFPISMSAWIGIDEIDEFILFIEQNIIPNMDLKFKDKSSEFKFKAKEMTLSFLVHEKRRRLTIKLNNYEPLSEALSALTYEFWTETQVDKFPQLLDLLKKVKNKELKFD